MIEDKELELKIADDPEEAFWESTREKLIYNEKKNQI